VSIFTGICIIRPFVRQKLYFPYIQHPESRTNGENLISGLHKPIRIKTAAPLSAANDRGYNFGILAPYFSYILDKYIGMKFRLLLRKMERGDIVTPLLIIFLTDQKAP